MHQLDDNVKESRNAIWEDRIRDLIDSGKTQKIWCRDNGISESTLRYWLRKLRINPSEKSNNNDSCNSNGWLQLPEPGKQKEHPLVKGSSITLSTGNISVNIPYDAPASVIDSIVKAMASV